MSTQCKTQSKVKLTVLTVMTTVLLYFILSVCWSRPTFLYSPSRGSLYHHWYGKYMYECLPSTIISMNFEIWIIIGCNVWIIAMFAIMFFITVKRFTDWVSKCGPQYGIFFSRNCTLTREILFLIHLLATQFEIGIAMLTQRMIVYLDLSV